MNSIWNSVTAWFKSKGGFTHVCAATFLACVGLYAGVPAFAQVVNSIYAAMPPWAHNLAAAAIGVGLWYANPSKRPVGSGKGVATLGMVLLLAVIGLTGCTNWERQSFQALSAAQAVLNQAQTDYTSGCPAAAPTDSCIPRNQTAFTVITKAKAADMLAVNAMVEYEQVKAASGAGSALNAAQIAAANALAQLPADLTAVKALYQTGGK